jgi:hypothetical protein
MATINQPVIRPGQHKPYFKATRRQTEQRIGAAVALRACRFSKQRIRGVFKKLFGVEWRQADRYMTRAMAENLSSMTVEPHKSPTKAAILP